MPGYLRYIFTLALKQKRSLAFLTFVLLLSVSARLTEPYLYKVVVDTLTNGLVRKSFAPEQTETLLVAIAAWFVLAIILNLASAQVSFLASSIGIYSSKQAHMTGYRRVLRLDYARHMKEHSSRFCKIVDDAETSTWEISNWWLGRFSSAILGFLGMLIIAAFISWPMTLITVSIIPPTFWFITRNIKKFADEQRAVNRLWEEKHEHLADQIGNIVTYKLNPHEAIFVKRHEAFTDRAYAAQTTLNRKWRIVEMLNPDALARFIVFAAGIFFVKDGSITLGTLIMFTGLLNEILMPLSLLSEILPQYTRHAQHIERLLGFLEEPDSLLKPAAPMDLSEVRGNIEFDHVSFAYPKEFGSFELVDVTFAISPGQTVALVGHSGSGKTTIMRLLNRLVDPSFGRITIDGIDLKELDCERIKNFVGTVLQENAIYNETVAQNIAYGDPTTTRERIIQAAMQAEAHEFIEKLPRGYETFIGERGERLSCGETQRIAIARAILKNPKVVVLDESTSALDYITGMKVQKAMAELMKGKATLIIAHRLSTVRHSDLIIVMENGRVICQGSHDELMTSCPTYKRMVDLQIEGVLADSDVH